MKNKHLIFLFLGIVALGFIARNIPWPWIREKPVVLIELDAAQITQISIVLPDQAELLLDRTDAGWVAAQNKRSVLLNLAQIAPILETLREIHAEQRVDNPPSDSLGCTRYAGISVQVQIQNGRREAFCLGRETIQAGQNFTFLRLPQHEGVYEVSGHLRSVFAKKVDDFREKQVLVIDPLSIRKISLTRKPELRLQLEKNDSTGRWYASEPEFDISDDSVQTWLNDLKLLNNGVFADYFDESRSAQTRLASISLSATGEPVVIEIYFYAPPDAPEDPSVQQQKPLISIPQFVVRSSQNPLNFFALPDTLLAHHLCDYMLPPPTTTITPQNPKTAKK